MFWTSKNTYNKVQVAAWPIPNRWDVLALLLVVSVIVLLGFAAKSMVGQYKIGEVIPISLDPIILPWYSLNTVFRMLIALLCSTIFTFVFGTWAAKSRQAERIIIPIIDILQSVPVLGFLSITVVGFVVLFRGSLLGPECAAIFAIFTAQVWNMTLSFYQSLKTVPSDLHEAADMFHLSAWQRFWRIDVPFAMPGLLWNAMMSMSSSWVFLVAAEAITVAGQEITLPGIGSYIYFAIEKTDKAAIGYVILTMFIVIALYDQLLFRPLVAWAEKFKAEETTSEVVAESWVLNLFQRTKLFQRCGIFFANVGDWFVNAKLFNPRKSHSNIHESALVNIVMRVIWNGVLVILVVAALVVLYQFIFYAVTFHEALHVIYLGMITAIRVMSLIVISSFIWVPVGVWIGGSPRASQIVQPIAQFFAAFPVNLLFPIAAFLIVRYDLNVNIWTSPLMILGTQWYILFNVIAGASALPKNMHHAVSTLNVTGWLWWRRFILPGIFPYYITGVITAAGGAWNISIIAEAVNWGDIHLRATGLGAYITEVATQGDFRRLALGITVMSLYVLTINRFIWRPLYNLAQERFVLR